MKLKYERPLIMVELFSPNQAIANCEQKDVIFDCMQGPNTDTDNVITEQDSCGMKATLFSGITKATYSSGSTERHSDYTGGTWSSSDGLTYIAPTGATGLLVVCANDNGTWENTHWSQQGDAIVHASRCRKTHVQIAPVYDTSKVGMGS